MSIFNKFKSPQLNIKDLTPEIKAEKKFKKLRKALKTPSAKTVTKDLEPSLTKVKGVAV